MRGRDDDTGELLAEAGREAQNEHSAMSRARALVGRKAGTVAFRRASDPALGDFDDTVIAGRCGETPADLTNFTCIE